MLEDNLTPFPPGGKHDLLTTRSYEDLLAKVIAELDEVRKGSAVHKTTLIVDNSYGRLIYGDLALAIRAADQLRHAGEVPTLLKASDNNYGIICIPLEKDANVPAPFGYLRVPFLAGPAGHLQQPLSEIERYWGGDYY